MGFRVSGFRALGFRGLQGQAQTQCLYTEKRASDADTAQ